MTVSMYETFTRLKYRYWPSHAFGEILSKSWMDTVIPGIVLAIVLAWLAAALPGFLSPGRFVETLRLASELGFLVLGMALVMIVGGIDLSVGSIFALVNLFVLYLINVLGWPVLPAIVLAILAGGCLGAANGGLIGYLRLGAFLTTLITLVIYRAIYDILSPGLVAKIASGSPNSDFWDNLGSGDVLGIPTQVIAYALVALIGHIFLTRLRPGWRLRAIGGSRRSAYNSGVPVRITIASCYVGSGMLAAVGAVFYAARLSSAGSDVGVGMEIVVLTAAILGGISLGGGKGSVAKALIGTLIVNLLTDGLVRLSFSGGATRMTLAACLVVGAIIDARFMKNLQRIINRAYVSPTYHRAGPLPSIEPDSGSPFAQNDALRDVELIGLGRIESPEDVILDREGNLYAGSRHGDVIRFFAPDFQRMEVFGHIGGQPLGMAFDRDDNLYVCVGGMGLYRITPDQKVELATAETNRSWRSINDDSRLRLADDLDIAPDGKVYFSEATTRYEMSEVNTDALEIRGNGRIICYDPKTQTTQTLLYGLLFPNGVCVSHDGQSIFFAETWGCRIRRYWVSGPKKGRLEIVIDNLPGYPDNINISSDGNYWLALVGMRAPAFDLAWRHPQFRKRMSVRLPPDEWLFPNVNIGFVLKFSENGQILYSMWDKRGANHPMITSMREDRGYLYLGGLSNNRIGRIKLEDGDPKFVQPIARWDGR
jgi:ribose transport system permease protein